jgi:hypothetical protein
VPRTATKKAPSKKTIYGEQDEDLDAKKLLVATAVNDFALRPDRTANLRRLFIAYFEWRRAVRRVYGRSRRRSQTQRQTGATKKVRKAERAAIQDFRRRLRNPLDDALAGASPRDEWGRHALLELRRDLGLADRRDDALAGQSKTKTPYLRIGIVRRGNRKTAPPWYIEPHAPGLPRALPPPKFAIQRLLDTTVFFKTPLAGDRAHVIRAAGLPRPQSSGKATPSSRKRHSATKGKQTRKTSQGSSRVSVSRNTPLGGPSTTFAGRQRVSLRG